MLSDDLTYSMMLNKSITAEERCVRTPLKLLKSPAWQERLAITDVWATRFLLLALLLLVGSVAVQTPDEAVYLQAGLAAQEQQEYWRAEAFFQEAALLAPDDERPLLDLARLHLLERQDDLAQRELEIARSLQADNADIWLALGDLARDEGHQPDAERAWMQAISFNPATAATPAHERLGLLYEQQGRWREAEAQFAALPGSDTLAQYHLGTLRLERGDLTGARQAFDAVLNLAGNDGLRGAAERFLQAINQWDGSARSEKLVGFAYIQNNLPTLALAPLQRAVALIPKDADAHAYLGWAYLRSGAASQAQQEARLAAALEPNNVFANYVLSQLDLADGRYASADADLGRALISDPQNPALWAARGAIAEQLHDLPFAERSLRRAVEDARGDPQYSLLLATFYANHQLGLDNGTALDAAQEAVAQNPGNGLAYDALGRIQQAMRDFPDALSAFTQAVNLAPTNAALHIHLGLIQADLGYLRSAELNLRKAIVLDLNGPIGRQAQEALQRLPPLDL